MFAIDRQRIVRLLSVFLTIVILYFLCLLWDTNYLNYWSSSCSDQKTPSKRLKTHYLTIENSKFLNCSHLWAWRKKRLFGAKKTIVLVGDSRIRLLYLQFYRMLNTEASVIPDPKSMESDGNIERSFYSSSLGIIVAYIPTKYPDDTLRQTLTRLCQTATPDYVAYETGSWPLYTYGIAHLEKFKDDLLKTAVVFASLPNVIWMQTLPFHTHVSSSHNKWVAERRGIYQHIEQYGSIVRKVASRFQIQVWTSAHDLAVRHADMYTDRIHANTELNYQFCCQLLCAITGEDCL